jgi:hypothetical protein
MICLLNVLEKERVDYAYSDMIPIGKMESDTQELTQECSWNNSRKLYMVIVFNLRTKIEHVVDSLYIEALFYFCERGQSKVPQSDQKQ